MGEPTFPTLECAHRLILALSPDCEARSTSDQYALGVLHALRVIENLVSGDTSEVATASPQADEAPPTAQVIDLMAALKASLARRGGA